MTNTSRFRISRNTVRFVSCIGLSLLLWIFTVLSHEHEGIIPVKMNYHFDDNKITTDKLPAQVKLTVRSNGWKLLRALYIADVVDIDSTDKKDNTVFVTGENLPLFSSELPEGIMITGVLPDTIIFNYEEKITKKIPVILDYNLLFQDKYDVVSTQISPDSITISGPKSQVESYTYWKTSPVKKDRVSKDLSGSIPLFKDDKMNVSQSAIVAHYEIDVEEFVNKELKIPVTVKNENKKSNVVIHTDSILLLFKVPQAFEDSINSSLFSAEIDLFKSRSDANKIYLTKWPSMVKVIDYYPKSADLSVK